MISETFGVHPPTPGVYRGLHGVYGTPWLIGRRQRRLLLVPRRQPVLLGRVAVCTAKAAYSHRPFPRTICWSLCLWLCLSVGLSVYLSVCLSVRTVSCGKTPNQIRMPFGMVGRTGSWMRQVVGFGDRSSGRGNWGAKMGRPIVINGNFILLGIPSAPLQACDLVNS